MDLQELMTKSDFSPLVMDIVFTKSIVYMCTRFRLSRNFEQRARSGRFSSSRTHIDESSAVEPPENRVLYYLGKISMNSRRRSPACELYSNNISSTFMGPNRPRPFVSFVLLSITFGGPARYRPQNSIFF